MIYGLYLSAAGMQTQNQRLDVIANNVANVSTTGFKRDVAIFQSRLPESQASARGLRYADPILDRLGGGTAIGATVTEFTQGEAEKTDRPLDICITGQGLLSVRDTDGQVRYTRDGHLKINDAGFLSLQDGQRLVLDSDGQPIQLDNSRATVIGTDGTVTQDGNASPIGQLGVVQFEDNNQLRKIGDGLYEAAPDAGRVRSPIHVVTQALERSASEPVAELVAMIDAQRAYEANAHMIRLQDESLGLVVNNLGRNL